MAMRRSVVVAGRVLGDALVTLGLVLVLFVGYSLWWSDLLADRASADAGARLRHGWVVDGTSPRAAAPSPTSAPAPAPAPVPAPARPSYRVGDDVGFLHVPAMGEGFQVLIRMGTDPDVLADGVAGVYTEPYPATMPWDGPGNFALAAHRDGHGAKFHDLDAVKQGDAVVVETRDRWYIYRVDGVLEETTPDNTGVIAPVPEGSPYRSPGRYITLTTCTPVYTSRYRMAVWGSLVREQVKGADPTPPAELR